jgi:succinoglycan biosynthesis protein ExoA
MQTQTERLEEVPPRSRPLVSVVLATYNEENSIERCLGSILRQQMSHPSIGEFKIEVLAVDGMSTDGTRALLEGYAAHDPRVRMINNQKRRAPFAFNLGLHHAQGEYVCILGAHTAYRDDYIAVCLAELLAHNAAACGGRVKTVPASNRLSARLSAWAMSHAFGSSRKSFRTQQEGPVDTINYAVFRRDLAMTAGGYDEDLLRNQDNDLNQKLRAAGFGLWCTWKTECLYFPKSTVSGLFRYAYDNGFWNALSMAKNPASMGLRHFVPFFFVVSLALTGFVAVAGGLALPHAAWMAAVPLVVLVGLHLLLGTAAAIDIAVRDRALGALWLPMVFLGFHFSYGFGTVRGFLSRPLTEWLPRERSCGRSVPFGE